MDKHDKETLFTVCAVFGVIFGLVGFFVGFIVLFQLTNNYAWLLLFIISIALIVTAYKAGED